MPKPIPLRRPITRDGELTDEEIADLALDYFDITFDYRGSRAPYNLNADWFDALSTVTMKLLGHAGVDWDLLIKIEKAQNDLKAKARAEMLTKLSALRPSSPTAPPSAPEPKGKDKPPTSDAKSGRSPDIAST
jgi:hypothetical protein